MTEKQKAISNRHLIDFYQQNEIQFSHKLRRSDSYQRLLIHNSPQRNKQNQIEVSEWQDVGNRKQDLIEKEVDNEDDWYVNYLSNLGNCCIPFKLLCPCIFCQGCICSSSPLYQQDTVSVGLLQEWGRFQRVLQPGLHIINPISQSITQINLQTKVIEYQQIAMSKDNVQCTLKIVIFYRVIHSLKFAYRLASNSQEDCIIQIATASLRSLLGQNSLQTIIENRQIITQQLTRGLNKQLQFWGIYVQISSIKEIFIDQEIMSVLQAVVINRRRMEAMIIDFTADIQTGILIKQISEIISNSASFQIRYLKAIEQIINNGNENIVFLKTSLYNKDQSQSKQ